MNRERFDELAGKVKKAWPPDMIIIDESNRLIIQCEGDAGYIKFGRMAIPDEMLNDPDVPQMTKDMLHDKLLIQWTDDIDAPTYKNIGRIIRGDEEYPIGPIGEALNEFSFRIQIGSVL